MILALVRRIAPNDGLLGYWETTYNMRMHVLATYDKKTTLRKKRRMPVRFDDEEDDNEAGPTEC